ncbi:uncharacterized protein LOC123508903 [Portunus trituberculatus]|uniref:uncharacterized protein LOC123508903 n=1 Tax=Portunus trituberculatus TaxID=210409 RepID=UPI001E1D147F|nr:uncharacterized protein LOC123508903 [Portunus trituberculatus]
MKAVVFLALLGVAAARPQFLLPHPQAPVITYKAGDLDDDAKVITSPLAYTFPSTFPSTFPLTYSHYPYTYPFINPLVANPAIQVQAETTRTKRDADPEPEAEAEADPFTIYSGLPIAGTTYPTYPTYSTYPTVSTYGAFPFTYATYPQYPYTSVIKTV